MQVSVAEGDPLQLAVDAIAVPLAAERPLSGPAEEIDRALGGIAAEAVERREHRGAFGVTLPLATGGRSAARRVLLYGLGDPAELDAQRLRFAHHAMARAARELGYRRLAVVAGPGPDEADLAAAVEGTVMGDWEPRSRQTGEAAVHLEQLHLVGFGPGRRPEAAAAQELAEAANRAREWQNLPANELSPEALADRALAIAARHHLAAEALGPAPLAEAGYRLLLGVAAGSRRQPRLVRVEHRGAPAAGAPRPTLALVGKGITFDSGGLSIKPASGMGHMKADMAGAAAVLCALDVIAARHLPLNVMAVVAASENMTGGAAQRPGDVVRSADGRTVEIVNTDAEGRLVLADALTYAIRAGATHLVDVATLTGAASVAVGHAATIVVAGDEGLWELLERAARSAGERVWRLPVYPEYRRLLRSSIADLKNSDYGEAGAITGGMFIGEFAAGRPWAHLDIAASSWNSNQQLSELPPGPLGAGTRLLVHLAERFAEAPAG